MKLDLSYMAEEDRMFLSISEKVGWLLTRSMLIKLVKAWTDRLEVISLPSVPIPLGARNIRQEHELSIEFDKPKINFQQPTLRLEAVLVQEVKLTVEPMSTQIQFKGELHQICLFLTRKESHMVLELLASKARVINWVDEIILPEWLGKSHINQDSQ